MDAFHSPVLPWLSFLNVRSSSLSNTQWATKMFPPLNLHAERDLDFGVRRPGVEMHDPRITLESTTLNTLNSLACAVSRTVVGTSALTSARNCLRQSRDGTLRTLGQRVVPASD